MARKQNPSGRKNNLSQFGLLDMDNDMDDMEIDNEDLDGDDDLEAELAAITSGGKPKPRQKPAPMSPANLNAMIAESLRDIPSDDEGSGDDDDPDLLNELQELTLEENESVPIPPPRAARPAPPPPGVENTMVNVLQERIANYILAEKNAKANGESSRARRFARGLKTLNDLLKQTKAGKSINEEDIPPIVSVGKQTQSDQPSSPPVPLVPEGNQSITPELPAESLGSPDEPSPSEVPKSPTPPTSTIGVDPEKQKGVQTILRRKEEFKAAALTAKRVGEKTLAMEYLKVMKMFDVVLDAYKKGEEMDLNELPTPDAIATAFKSSSKEEEQSQKSTGILGSIATIAREYVVGEYVQAKEVYQRAAAEAQTASWKRFCSAQDGESLWDGIYRVIRETGKNREDILLHTDSGLVLSPNESATLLAETFFPDDRVDTDYPHHAEVRRQTDGDDRPSATSGDLPGVDSPFTGAESWDTFPGLEGGGHKGNPEAGQDDYARPKSYRPIGLLPVLGKTVERMLVGRLQWHLMPKLQATQYGFMPQRGRRMPL
ncbi:Coiled-coil and C2 domain-containing protein 1-like [Eumeta japonica]|uniref:Coiled-coil and C2 domain-containing protein 1-like n=1 Tax=Eumeta variegata TaxID=151549 RepID=A0A4C1V1G1_EUMVA|nr:Coiled-coil and C2 domain-containing protein 1-like [Eumeta japonica]